MEHYFQGHLRHLSASHWRDFCIFVYHGTLRDLPNTIALVYVEINYALIHTSYAIGICIWWSISLHALIIIWASKILKMLVINILFVKNIIYFLLIKIIIFLFQDFVDNYLVWDKIIAITVYTEVESDNCCSNNMDTEVESDRYKQLHKQTLECKKLNFSCISELED